MSTRVAVSVRTDVRAFRATLDRVGRQQLPYAAAKAINTTLLAVQAAERRHLRTVFTLRRAPFVDRLVKIEKADFATKQNPVGTVGIQGERADLLAKFEEGGTKTPRGLSLAIPVVGGPAKPRATSIVKAELRPGALLGNSLLSLRAFVRPFKADPGKRGVFVVDRSAVAKAQRLKGRRGGKAAARTAAPRLAFVLQPSAPIPAELRFLPTARAVIAREFVPNLRAAVAEALRTAKAP